jgi:threonine aldolase
VDVLCLGGSKNGLAVGEAVIFFDLDAAAEFDYRCKQAGQLAAKMRFIAAQWVGLLRTGAWKRHAAHANRCAATLARELEAILEVEIVFPVEANAVFVRMPAEVIESLRRRGWHFYTFIGEGEARLMCSWDTADEAIRLFVANLKASIAEAR